MRADHRPQWIDKVLYFFIHKRKDMDDTERLYAMRHSLAHILAQAVLQKYPQAKLGMGPAIEDGFYYDFDLGGKTFSPEDLRDLQKRMKKIIAQGQIFEKYEVDVDAAIDYLRKKQQPYKVELAQDLKKAGAEKLSFYRNIIPSTQKRMFVDLCRGPHVSSTKEIGAFTLTRTSGAYWKGDEKRPMLQRIYGVAFQTEEDLEHYLNRQREAQERDHRKLGQELGIFMFSEEIGQGLPVWLPNGALLRNAIEEFILEQYQKNGYTLVRTPHIASERLFSLSGHLDYYRDGMYSPMVIDDERYYLKPMNCPFHLMIYKQSLKSYRDLPIRYAELGTVYRYERSGTMHGLTRVRGFTQDDGHILCTPEQLHDEIFSALELIQHVLRTFGFQDFQVMLSVRDKRNTKKYLGKDSSWEYAESALLQGVEKIGWEYQKEEGEAVFYGPKIDILVKDSLQRKWQLSTLQVDFNLPKRFHITYIDVDGKKREPFMLHRALLGSIERFTAILIEHYAGAFPFWLAPLQVHIAPVGKDYFAVARSLGKDLQDRRIRVWVDEANETVSYKVRKGEKMKIPYILVIGEKEAKSNILTVRERQHSQVREISRDDFFQELQKKLFPT